MTMQEEVLGDRLRGKVTGKYGLETIFALKVLANKYRRDKNN